MSPELKKKRNNRADNGDSSKKDKSRGKKNPGARRVERVAAFLDQDILIVPLLVLHLLPLKTETRGGKERNDFQKSKTVVLTTSLFPLPSNSLAKEVNVERTQIPQSKNMEYLHFKK